MTRIMRDSTVATDIPVAGTDIVLGYSTGKYMWTAEDYARFPKAAHVSIDVTGNDPAADMLDVESGDATVQMAVQWVREKLLSKPPYPPLIYANRSTLTPLFNAMDAAGLHVKTHFMLCIATLDGTKTVPDMTGVTAVQYAGQSQTKGHYDESIVYDDTWKAPSKPTPPVVPAPPVPPTQAELIGELVTGLESLLVVARKLAA